MRLLLTLTLLPARVPALTSCASSQGALEFSMSYESEEGRRERQQNQTDIIVPEQHVEPEFGILRVHLRRGVDLLASDTAMFESGKSDPFVLITAGDSIKKKSQTMFKTLDPEWDEFIDFEGDINDFLNHPLHLKVLDSDMMGAMSEPLGELQVAVINEEIRQKGGREFNEQLPTQGSIEFAVLWKHKKQIVLRPARLCIHLHKAHNLRSVPHKVYVTAHAGDPAHPAPRSATVDNNLNPVWKEDLYIEGARHYCCVCSLFHSLSAARSSQLTTSRPRLRAHSILMPPVRRGA